MHSENAEKQRFRREATHGTARRHAGIADQGCPYGDPECGRVPCFDCLINPDPEREDA